MTNGKTSERLEVCWRVIDGSNTRMLACSIFAVGTTGVELRVGYIGEPSLRSQVVADIDSARVLAKQWLNAVRVGNAVPPRKAGSISGLNG